MLIKAAGLAEIVQEKRDIPRHKMPVSVAASQGQAVSL